MLGIKDETGTRISTSEEIVRTAATFCRVLYSRNIKENMKTDKESISEGENISIPPREVRITIMELKHGKSAGDDVILNKYLRLVVKNLVLPITKVLTPFWGKRKYHLSGSGVSSFYCQNKVLRMI
jgi:hypothetical protein